MRSAMLMLAAAAAILVATSEAQAWSGYGGLDFGAAVARTKAKYSRYNYNTHPRSYYNEPYYYPRSSYYPRSGYYPRSSRYGRGPREYYSHEYEFYGRGREEWIRD